MPWHYLINLFLVNMGSERKRISEQKEAGICTRGTQRAKNTILKKAFTNIVLASFWRGHDPSIPTYLPPYLPTYPGM